MSKQKTAPNVVRLDVQRPESLSADVIHLYVVSVRTLPFDDQSLNSYLNEDEQARASRFINPEHGQQFRRVRGVLRYLLAHYLDIAPPAVKFEYAKHGKPSIKANPTLYFNLSHSRDMAAYAFSLEHELGVDIEFMREQSNLAGMISHVGSEKEQRALLSLQGPEVYEAFYRLWTRKEAFIKAVGRGLGMGLRSIHVGVDASSSLIEVDYKDRHQPEWCLKDLDAPQGYKLALCCKN